VKRKKLWAHLIEGEAACLPLADNLFDAVLNFGGINALGDQRKALEEMVRVAKPGARIVISDQGVRLTSRHSFRNRLLVRANPLYASEPPLRLIPPGAKDVRLTWFRADSAYILDFVKP
jgi:ubiquinone/menaquinone biosynthesis C-methylase UbiE